MIEDFCNAGFPPGLQDLAKNVGFTAIKLTMLSIVIVGLLYNVGGVAQW